MKNTINPDGTPVHTGLPSFETRQLVEFLKTTERPFLSYQELSAVIERNVQTEARACLLTARRIVLHEKGFVYRPVRNSGIKRLTSREVPAAVEDRFSHVRRTHRQTVRELSTVNLTELEPTERTAYLAKLSLAALTVHTHDAKQRALVEASVTSQKQLSLGETLAAFQNEKQGSH